MTKCISSICPDKIVERKLKTTLNKIVSRNYTKNNIIKKCSYVLCHKIIKEKFLKEIVTNIEKDIDKMDSL